MEQSWFFKREIAPVETGPPRTEPGAPEAGEHTSRPLFRIECRGPARPSPRRRPGPSQPSPNDRRSVRVVDAIGEPKVLREMLKRLAAKEWAGKAVKMRAR